MPRPNLILIVVACFVVLVMLGLGVRPDSQSAANRFDTHWARQILQWPEPPVSVTTACAKFVLKISKRLS